MDCEFLNFELYCFCFEIKILSLLHRISQSAKKNIYNYAFNDPLIRDFFHHITLWHKTLSQKRRSSSHLDPNSRRLRVLRLRKLLSDHDQKQDIDFHPRRHARKSDKGKPLL
jgi:hypothetical protein